jgi:Beta-propeller repeat
VIKFDRDGHYLWKRQPGTASSDCAKGVATDADGNVYAVGYTSGSLGGSHKGDWDPFVIKYGPNGPR